MDNLTSINILNMRNDMFSNTTLTDKQMDTQLFYTNVASKMFVYINLTAYYILF